MRITAVQLVAIVWNKNCIPVFPVWGRACMGQGEKKVP